MTCRLGEDDCLAVDARRWDVGRIEGDPVGLETVRVDSRDLDGAASEFLACVVGSTVVRSRVPLDIDEPVVLDWRWRDAVRSVNCREFAELRLAVAVPLRSRNLISCRLSCPTSWRDRNFGDVKPLSVRLTRASFAFRVLELVPALRLVFVPG